MDEYVEIKFKDTNIRVLTVQNIQKILLWINNLGPKPRYIGAVYKEKIQTINVVNIKDYKYKPMKIKKSATSIIHDTTHIVINDYINNRSVISGRVLNCNSFSSLVKQIRLKGRSALLESICKKNKNKPSGTVREKEEYYDLSLINESSIQEFIVKDWKAVYLEQDMFVDSTAILYKDFTSFEELKNTTDYFLVSVDCEMTMSDKGYELGRVSILDNNGNTLYDKIIEPKNPIKDYLTQYSGLTKESFDNAITYEQMKEEVCQIIGKNTVILGHGLFNDLNMLKIKHDKFIDTSFMYRTRDNYRLSLKKLAKSLLQRDIQESTHCSIEDGMSCLELLALKIGEFIEDDNGIDYGVPVKFCENIRDMLPKGINFIELRTDDAVPFANSFNLYFYESDGNLFYIL